MSTHLHKSMSFVLNNPSSLIQFLPTFMLLPHGKLRKEQDKAVLIPFCFPFFNGLLREGIHDSSLTEEEFSYLQHWFTPDEQLLLDQFGPHTLEALFIHIMSTMFWSDNSVRLATRVERIEEHVQHNAARLASLHGITTLWKDSNKDPRLTRSRISWVLRLPFGKALAVLVENKFARDWKNLKTYLGF